jgi:cytoskeletal protein RodZ
VGGDLSKRGPRGNRPLRIRPHWWAVLAVSLSLLALVAATAGQPRGPDHHRTVAAPSNGRPATSSTTSTSASTTTTAPGLGAGLVTPSTSSPAIAPETSSATGGAKPQVVTSLSATPPSAPAATTTTTTAPPSGSTVAAAPPPPAPVTVTVTEYGDLQYPYDATATRPFVGAGSMRVTATWPTTPTVSLTVTCPAGTLTSKGSLSVTVLVPDADGPCTYTLKELLVQYAAVSYTLTIAPAGG